MIQKEAKESVNICRNYLHSDSKTYISTKPEVQVRAKVANII